MGGSRQGQVNLARRPFVNRRPILRLAVLLWLLGIALLVVNVRLYAGHWRGKAMNNQRLTEVDLELERQRQEFGPLDRELQRVNLARQNRQTRFLNSLITYRTFPWSSLFDDLEEVLPRQVRLLSVKPSVKLASGTEEPRRGRRRGRSRTSAAEAAATGGGEAAAPARVPLKRNEVSLSLSAVAEEEDALYELIDRLYASTSFRNPFLPGEVRNLEDGSTSFSVSVVYLTRPDLPEEPEPVLAEDASDPAAGTDEVVLVSPDAETETEEPEAAAQGPSPPTEPEVAAGDRDRPAGASPATGQPAAAAGGGDPAALAARRLAAARSAATRSAAAPPPAARPEVTPRASATSAGRPATGRPATGAASSGRTGTPPPPSPQTKRPAAERPSPGRPAPEKPPVPEEPPFVEPAASATPRVQTGSLLPVPGDSPRPGTRDREAVT